MIYVGLVDYQQSVVLNSIFFKLPSVQCDQLMCLQSSVLII